MRQRNNLFQADATRYEFIIEHIVITVFYRNMSVPLVLAVCDWMCGNVVYDGICRCYPEGRRGYSFRRVAVIVLCYTSAHSGCSVRQVTADSGR